MYNVHIMTARRYIDFEWDDRKAAINIEKHGVSFNSAIEHFQIHMLVLFQMLNILITKRDFFL